MLAAFACVLGSGHASAATHTFSWLVDSDNNVATGCTLATAHGPLAGIEQVFIATVTTTTADAGVTRLERRLCANGALGAPTTYDTGAWPVGLGLGTGSSAVIETYAPLSMLPQSGTLKVVVTSSNATGGEDATAPFLIALDASQSLAAVVAVPLSRWLVLPLALLLFGTAWRWYRRHPGQRNLGMFFALCVVAGLACAATVLLDGNPADWAATPPSVTDAAGNAPPNADIVAVYQQHDATRLFVRIDADIRVEDAAQPGPKLAAIPDQVISLGRRLRLRISANDADTFTTLTFGLVTAPSGAAFDPTPVLDWTPGAAQLGPHLFTVSATDSAGHGDARSFTVTVVDADQPPMLADQPDTTLALGSTFSRVLVAADPDAGDVLSFALVSAPGGMTLNGATLNWPTNGAALGSHPVTVSVTDVAGAMDVRQFHVIVSASAPPVANADSYSVRLGDTLTLAAPGVLANDIDPFGRPLTASRLSDPDKGTLATFHADGSFSYVAPPTLPVATFQPVVKTNVEFGANFSSHFVVADLDGDGKAEIVVRYLNAGIAVFHQDGSLMWSRASFAAPYSDCYAFLGSSGWSVAVGDLADDGKLEIVMPVSCNRDEAPPFSNGFAGAGPESRYIALNGLDGSVRWLSSPLSALDLPSGPSYQQYPLARGTSPTIARLRAGESPSVLLEISDRGGATVSIDSDGNAVTGAACSHLVQNVADGDPAFYNHYRYCRGVVVLDGVDGSVRQRMIAPGTYPGAYNGDSGYEQTGNVAPIVADLDGDGVQEIVAGSAVFNVDGSIKWQLPDQSTSDTALGNFDDTPDIEVVRFESQPDPALAVYKSDGRLLWRLPFDPQTVV
ncbi:MAG: Ig-like domain-containing protein, partial [Casimicrobiaceae bacterium]